jgi:hypothetical protein
MDFKTQIYGMFGLLVALLIGAILWLIGLLIKKDTIETTGKWIAVISAAIMIIIYIFDSCF